MGVADDVHAQQTPAEVDAPAVGIRLAHELRKVFEFEPELPSRTVFGHRGKAGVRVVTEAQHAAEAVANHAQGGRR